MLDDNSSERGDRSAVGESAARLAHNVQGAVRDKTVEKADAGVHRAADGIHTAAEKMRDRADGMGGIGATAGEKAAEVLDSTAGYLDTRGTDDILLDLRAAIRRHPIQAVIIAFVAGYLVRKMVRLGR